MRLQPVEETLEPVSRFAQAPCADGGVAATFDQAGAMVAARYSAELAAFRSVPELRLPAAVLLAARATAGAFATLAEYRCLGAPASRLAFVCCGLAGALPDAGSLEDAWRQLGLEKGFEPAADFLDGESLAQVQRLWTLAIATEQLLVQGGDDRLTLDPVTGLNRYGCAPRPRTDVVAFGSCTASSISARGFVAADAMRRYLLGAALEKPIADALDDAAKEITGELLRYFGLQGDAAAMLVASGTDAALVVTAMIAAAHPGLPLTSILMSPSETGSGVPQAVQGRHFASWTASGEAVTKGSPLDGLSGLPALQTIELRDGAGEPRSAAAIGADCEAAVDAAAARGHVVLHAIDGSKTGLTAPGRETLRRLRAKHGARLTIVVDACQVRIEPSLVRAYATAGYFVLVTGSKFFAAPGFCGAVLIPRLHGGSAFAAGVPVGLRAYATAAGGMIARRCPGLLLRWAAALDSMGRFAKVPSDKVRAAIGRSAADVRSLFGGDARLRLIAAPRPAGAGWSDAGSVITFAVRRGGNGTFLPADGLRPLYLALADDCSAAIEGATEAERRLAGVRCQIGQPVCLGDAPFGGLRIAFSADQLVDGHDAGDALRLVFDKLKLLLERI